MKIEVFIFVILQMCFTAVIDCEESNLKTLGLVLGDIIKLKTFCSKQIDKQNSKEQIKEKKALLEVILANNKKKRKTTIDPKASLSKVSAQKNEKKVKPSTCTTRKVNVGWLHFINNAYKSVRQSEGGGTRQLTLSVDATKDAVIDASKQCFFPSGNSKYGDEDSMDFSIADFQRQEIQEPFSVELYAMATKLPRLKLFLTSKPKKVVSSLVNVSDDDSDEAMLLTSMLDLEESNDVQIPTEESDGEITFKGENEDPQPDNNNDTLPDLDPFQIQNAGPTPPDQLMEQDTTRWMTFDY